MFIFVVEDLKAVKKLQELNLFAITGSPAFMKRLYEAVPDVFSVLSMIIVADRNGLSHEHARQAAMFFYGRVASLIILELPDRNGCQVKDISDWLASGGTRQELEQLCGQGKEWQPAERDNLAYLVPVASVHSESVEWLWYPYLPKSKLTLLEGDPGVGKSWLSLAIAAAISTGQGLPGQENRNLAAACSGPAAVLLASAEDGLGDTIRPRLNALGARVENIQAIGGPLGFDDKGLEILEKFIRDLHPALIIIDPLVAYMGAGVDMHRANETRAILSRLAHVSEKHAVSILAVRHLAKGVAVRPIYRGLGSIDITAACRSVLLAGCDPENPQIRALVHIKSNLAPPGGSMGYEIRDGNFYWTGESCLSAERILSAAKGVKSTALDEAAEFLKDELSNGPVEANTVFKDAEDNGISKITLKRAKGQLKVISRRTGKTGEKGGAYRFFWELPAV